MKGEQEGEIGKVRKGSGKTVLRSAGQNVEQQRHVFSKAPTALNMFLNGIPVQIRSSLLPLSLLFIFHCAISIFPYFSYSDM